MASRNRKLIPLTAQQVQRFWSKVKIQPNGCWEWQASCFDNGYGQFSYQRNGFIKNALAHRVAYFIYYGTDPNEYLVCHHCDNRKCVNPFQFFLGTYLDNNHDRDKKGHTNKGENHHLSKEPRIGILNGKAKLDEDNVREIKKLSRQGFTQVKLAKTFKVGRTAIQKILNGENWSHIN